MTHRTYRGALACALLATTSLCLPAIAYAQASDQPAYRQIDENGVDLTRGDLFFTFTEGSIGSGDALLTLMRHGAASQASQWDGLGFHKFDSGTSQVFSIGLDGIADRFTGSGPSIYATGAELLGNDVDGYSYRSRDGTVIAYGDPSGHPWGGYTNFCAANVVQQNCVLLPMTITAPNGRQDTLDWDLAELCDANLDCSYWWRLASISNSYGYKIEFSYQAEAVPGNNPPNGWFTRTQARFINTAVSSSPQSTVSYAYPSSTVTQVTDPAGRVWRFASDANGHLTGFRRPGAASDTTTNTWGTSGVSSVTDDGVTTTYSRAVSANTATMTVTNAFNQVTTVVSDLTVGRPTSYDDPVHPPITYQYDSNGRLTRATAPEGNYVQLTYDARGNVTTTTNVAKSGSGLSNIVTSASFDTACTNPIKCNKPNSTTDAKGNVTDYTYDPTHGGLLTVTSPAPNAGGIRPQARFSYTLLNGEYQLTGIAQCQTQSSCTGAADEAKLTIAYDGSGNVTSVSRGNGTGTLIATENGTYDAVGNLLTVDGPLPGTADTTRLRYSAARELTGMISPDPDGAGIGNPNRAIRLTYRSDGQVSKEELGTVPSQSDSDWTNNFTALQTVDIGFDANSRPVTSKLSASSADYALTQVSYDALGRLECSAVRMNIAAFGSLPSSACDQGTAGSFGPDRISKLVYDAAGQVLESRVAVKASGGSDPGVAERTLTYTNNGQLATLKDGENNLTTFEYDGFDRLNKTRFPVTTKGANSSSTTDYEQLGYDENSNVTSRTLRDGQVVNFVYDNLDRLTTKAPPNPEPSTNFGYDNLRRLTSVDKPGIGISLSFTYDALGRQLSESKTDGSFVTAASSEYDVADRRTKLSYPGTGLYVNYDYLVTGEVSAIRENGATSGVGVLASYGYDNLGRRTSVTFGNGISQAFSYDAVSRLASLTNDLSGTNNDLTIGSINYNPASQIVSLNRSNNDYAFTGHANGSTPYYQDGRNATTQVGFTDTLPDARGNITKDPASGKTFTYWPSTDQLRTVSSPFTALSYDGLDRLATIDSTADTKVVYDGLETLAEYDGSNALQKRYVFGPGMDEPIVEYDASGNRRFLSSDERGSIISASNSSGALLAINTYDEYGKPGASNTGRFQYTGQKWIGEAGLYDYKARSYLPGLGIFGQTDPIGYEDSTNLYAYVGNDPINFIDPLGLQATEPDIFVTGTLSYRLGGPGGEVFLGTGVGTSPSGVPNDRPIMIIARPAYPANPLPLQPAPCTLCNARISGNWDKGFVITGRRVPTEPFVLRDGRYVYSGYVKPSWSNAFDAAVGCLAVCPLAAAFVGTEALVFDTASIGFRLYGRGTKWQVMTRGGFMKVRRDIMKPHTHFNVEIGPWNWHIPPR